VPVGAQVAAAYGRDDLLFGLGAQLEAARPWTTAAAWPPRPEADAGEATTR
jgi:amidase